MSKRALGLERHLEARRAKRETFLKLYDFTQGRGLEIGPLDAAIADPDHDDVRFVDVFDQAGIRAKYGPDENVILECIPEIHFPLIPNGGEARSLSEAAAPGAPYDWTIASHVIEHVPDVIGWLAEVAELTVDGGALVLAVPDRRYCFDRHRPPTTVGQMIQAHRDGDQRPSIRAIYDATSTAVMVNTAALWRGRRPPPRSERYATDHIPMLFAQYDAGEYIDRHVWLFTPDWFVEQIKELRSLGLCDWYVAEIHVIPDDLEFHAVLRRVGRDTDLDQVDAAEVPLAHDLPDWLHDEWTNQDRARRAERRVAKLEATNARLRRKIERLEGRLDRLNRSASMRVGRTIVAPGSAVRKRLRRRPKRT